MKLWWLGDFARLGQEKRAVEAIALREPWFKLDRWCFREGKLAALGTIFVEGQPYPVLLLYPDQFPEVPAWVEPQEDVRWSTHQYGRGGTLCLELRPDNWVASATGADVLRSAYNLLVSEKASAQDPKVSGVPSAHDVGEVQSYDWGTHPVLIGVGCLERIKAGTVQDPKALRWMAMDEVWPIMIHDAEDRTSPRRPPSMDINSWRFEIPIYVLASPAPADIADNRHGFLTALGLDAGLIQQIAERGAAIWLFTGGPEPTAFHLMDEGKPHRRKIFVLPDQAESRSGRTPEAVACHAAVIGAGSVGSKIAEMLVRSGISRLTLVDGDVMLPGNTERHTLDWRDVGFRKVHGLKRHLLHISPGAEITVIDQNLNWQRSAHVHASQTAQIAECDLIIDATGDAATSLFLGAVAAANNRPFISVEVYEGGIGALIASCLPGRDPPFAAARAAYFAWCDQKNMPPPRPAARAYDALAEDGTLMVADDAAATMTASHAARVALDVLDGRPAASEAAWMLIGFRKSWVFEAHGHTWLLNVGNPAAPAEDTKDAEAEAFVLALAKEYFGANATGE
ncbi:MAG: ThiF family adenylyltransferase [Proteobacteria bacterium]|nr:ThiF family adenylyltransferase [Pseudomonadota bacterium]